MIKNILVILAILFVAGTHAMAYNYYSMSNPANPISPLNPMNPANPASPLNPIHRNNNDANYVRKTTNKEEYTYNVYKVYELCYKGSCRQTRSHELKTVINRCLRHGGGNACLYKVVE